MLINTYFFKVKRINKIEKNYMLYQLQVLIILIFIKI
ncbi:hypothetical protein HNQ90_001547 [Algibacter amylolyticus]|nr:hypothetical protein [Algibacter amylolyticus]